MDFEISRLVKSITGSERAQAKLVFPEGLIKLSLGQPDFPTPEHIKEAAFLAMKKNFTRYVDPMGDTELREAVCLSYKRDYDVDLLPENILITAGGIEAVSVAAATYVNPGDEVLIMDPEYSAYPDAVKLFGGKTVRVPLGKDLHPDFETIERHITKKTKMLFLSNPCNPTGQVLFKDEVEGLAEIAREHDLLLVVDEVYHKLIYNGQKHYSIREVEQARDRTILINSFSKTYSMTGWRIGYIVAESNIIRNLLAAHRTFMYSVNAPAQKACVAALTGSQDCVQNMLAEYERRRRLAQERLQGIQSLSTPPCQGAFYFFPRFTHRLTSIEMVSYVAERGVVVRSGTEFGENGQKHVRISFSVPVDVLEKGIEKLREALDDLD